MGLNFSYLLYFKKEDLWHALDGLLAMAEHHKPPTIIHFPDHQKEVPMDSWPMHREVVRHDDPHFSFASVLKFDWDEDIDDWISRIQRDNPDRSPPNPEEGDQVTVGYIYLTIHVDLKEYFQYQDEKEALEYVVFEFDTTGTRMSTLFSNSTSIRKAFVELLENYRGVCGVFNYEDGGGEVFWLGGQTLETNIGNPYQLPSDIRRILKEGW